MADLASGAPAPDPIPDAALPEGSVFAAGLRFVPRSEVLDADDLARATRRIAHEIIERNQGVDNLVIIGLHRGGVAFGQALTDALSRIEGREVAFGVLDVSFYRDDINIRRVIPQGVTNIPGDLSGQVVVLADNVLFTGRTVRAALDALNDHGRPRAVQLAVLVDRGHRELPIRPDYVGKNLPTRRDEHIIATLDGVTIGELA